MLGQGNGSGNGQGLADTNVPLKTRRAMACDRPCFAGRAVAVDSKCPRGGVVDESRHGGSGSLVAKLSGREIVI